MPLSDFEATEALETSNELTCESPADFASPESSDSRGKNWFFTLFEPHYDSESIQRYTREWQALCTFAVFQEEICPSSGRRHLQGCLQLKEKTRFAKVKEQVFGTGAVHLQPIKALRKAINYCSKERTRAPGTLPVRIGDQPTVQGQRSDLAIVADMVRAKRSLADIAEQHPATYIRVYRGISALQGALIKPRNFQTEVFWYYGPTGSGKTRRAFDLAPQAYRIVTGKQ